jgi:hypothetical protein
MAWKKNPKNRLLEHEAALIKAMLAEPNHTDQEILAYFTRPDRNLNHARIIEIRNGLTFENVAPASTKELDEFRKKWTHPTQASPLPEPPPELIQPPAPPTMPCLKGAYQRLWWGIQSVNALWEIFHEKAAAAADENIAANQLRAMVSFAGAALDATLKQLVADATPQLMQVEAVRSQITERFARRLRREDAMDMRALVDAMLSESPREHAISMIVQDVMGGSLQSVQAVSSVAALLGLETFRPAAGLAPAFKARNQIVHEMDATSEGPRERSKGEMESYARVLLETATAILAAIDGALKPRD